MNPGGSLRRNVRLIGVGARVTTVSLLVVYLYSIAIHQFESPGPVEKWMQIGIERHRLELLNSPEMMPPEIYESKLQRLLREEEVAVEYGWEFPQDMDELANYEKARHWLPSWPVAFWIAFACALLTVVATEFWLRGASWAARDTQASSLIADRVEYDHDSIRTAVDRRLTHKYSGQEPQE